MIIKALRGAVIVSFLAVLNVFAAKTIDTIAIQGLSINQPSVVRNTILLKKDKEFNSPDIQESIRKLYSLGLFKQVDIFVTNETDSTVSLLVGVEEFPICEGIEWSGTKKIKDKELSEKIPLKKGQIVTDAILFKTKKVIKKQYDEKGFLVAQVSSEKIKTKIPGNVIVKFSIKEGSKVKIKEITFQGNKAVKSKTLLSKLKTKESRWWRSGEFEDEKFRSHLDTLILYYNDLGYLDASIIRDSLWYSNDKRSIFINIVVDEGKKYYAGDFSFSGNRIIETDSLQTKIQLKRGKPFKKSRFDLSKYLIENTYREDGYLWVQVQDKRTFRGDTIDVNFDITEGRPAIVRKIDIKGNTKTMEKVIRREIDVLPGRKYKQSLMMSSRQKIMSLNYFNTANPDLSPNEDGTIDLVFDITEKDNIGQLQVGAAYSAVDKFVGTFSTSIPNFRGAGQTLNLNLEYGGNRKNVSLGFEEPWAFDAPTSLSGTVFYSENDINSLVGNVQSYGFTIGAGRSRMTWPDNHFRIGSTYELSYSKAQEGNHQFNNVRIPKEGIRSSLSLTLRRYDLDVPLFPTSGSLLTINPEIAGLGGTYKYLKGTISDEQYFPLPYKLVLGLKAKFGHIAPLSGKEIVIPSHELFYLGGVMSVDADLRGYLDRSYGGPNGISLFASTVEIRYPLLEQQIYLGIFADAGNVWPSLSEVNLLDVKKSIGAGFRLNIPMLGIMGFDFAYALNSQNDPHFDEKGRGWKIEFLMNRGF